MAPIKHLECSRRAGVLAPPFYPLYPLKEALSTPNSITPLSSSNGFHFPIYLINLSLSREIVLKNHDFKVSYHLAMAIVNSPVGIRKHYHSNIAASIKAIAKNVNLLDAWDYEEKNWQVNSCFLPQI